MEKEQELTRNRASIILQVRSGSLTVRAAAKRWGISRKTYYKWENRALRAMAMALKNRSSGRPPVSLDVEKELREKVGDLERRLYLTQKTIEVRNLLSVYNPHHTEKYTKKEPKDGKRRNGR